MVQRRANAQLTVGTILNALYQYQALGGQHGRGGFSDTGQIRWK
jgi:hypothetical protein